MLTLCSSRLRVEIAEPGERPNCGFRFDRSGFISEVILDGTVRFCASEPSNLAHPSSGGRGLCSEIQMDFGEDYEAALPYPKFGGGIIPNSDGSRYCFYRKYGAAEEFPVTVKAGENQAVFHTQAVSCRGYALEENKTVTVEENRITVDYQMKNTGDKELRLREYVHNFLSVDGMALSPAYHLELPSLPDLGTEPIKTPRGQECNFCGEGHGLTFQKADVAEAMFEAAKTDTDETLPFRWKLSHDGAKAWVAGEDWFVPSAVTVWAVDHMVSPEIFHAVCLQPGESASWKRSWSFEAER